MLCYCFNWMLVCRWRCFVERWKTRGIAFVCSVAGYYVDLCVWSTFHTAELWLLLVVGLVVVSNVALLIRPLLVWLPTECSHDNQTTDWCLANGLFMRTCKFKRLQIWLVVSFATGFFCWYGRRTPAFTWLAFLRCTMCTSEAMRLALNGLARLGGERVERLWTVERLRNGDGVLSLSRRWSTNNSEISNSSFVNSFPSHKSRKSLS